jgi:hypothetical protein
LNHTHRRIASDQGPMATVRCPMAVWSREGKTRFWFLVSGFLLVATRANQKPETRNGFFL